MLSEHAIRDANVRYHDLAAGHYDAKWGISYGALGQAQVTGKLRKALGREPGRYGRALEIGAGTGYFTLNLLRAGTWARPWPPTSPPGCWRRSRVGGRAPPAGGAASCEASSISLRGLLLRHLVFGHAVLHHLPDLEAAFGEFPARAAARRAWCLLRRALPLRPPRGRPPKRGELAVAPLWRALMGAGPRPATATAPAVSCEEDRLEALVDVHFLHPGRAGAPGGRRRIGGRAGGRRGAHGRVVRLGQPDARVHGRSCGRSLGVAGLRPPGLPGPAGRGPLAARAPPAPGAVLQPAGVGPRPG